MLEFLPDNLGTILADSIYVGVALAAAGMIVKAANAASTKYKEISDTSEKRLVEYQKAWDSERAALLAQIATLQKQVNDLSLIVYELRVGNRKTEEPPPG